MENKESPRGSTTNGSIAEILAYSELSKGDVFGALILEKIASILHRSACASEKKSNKVP